MPLVFFPLQAIYNNCEEFHFSSKETAVCNQADHEIQQVSPFVTSLQLSTHPNTHIPRGHQLSVMPPSNTANWTADHLLQNYQQLL